METNNIALFIDVENLFHKSARPRLSLLIDHLKEKGRLIARKAYADWGQFSGLKREMQDHSFELIELPSHGPRGKNSVDIKLVVDAFEMMVTREHIDTYAIVSGDSDYIPLISKLREYGKYVIVIAYDPHSTGKLIAQYCDELIYYTRLAGIDSSHSADLSEAYQLLLRAIQVLENQGGQPRGSLVKPAMKRLDATFDEAHYGFKQFKEFLNKACAVNRIEMEETVGGDCLLRCGQKAEQTNVKTLEITTEKPELLPELDRAIYWVIKIHQTNEQSGVRLGVLKQALLKIIPQFNHKDYQCATFKRFIERQYAVNNSVRLYLDQKNEPWVQILPEWADRYSGEALPASFYPLLIESFLLDAGLNVRQPELEAIYQIAEQCLEAANGCTLELLIETVKHEVFNRPEHDQTHPLLPGKILGILSLCRSFLDKTGKEVRASDQLVQQLLPIGAVLQNYAELLEKKWKEWPKSEVPIEVLFQYLQIEEHYCSTSTEIASAEIISAEIASTNNIGLHLQEPSTHA